MFCNSPFFLCKNITACAVGFPISLHPSNSQVTQASIRMMGKFIAAGTVFSGRLRNKYNIYSLFVVMKKNLCRNKLSNCLRDSLCNLQDMLQLNIICWLVLKKALANRVLMMYTILEYKCLISNHKEETNKL